MEHPIWCEEDDCGSGFHALRAEFECYSVKIGVRVCQDIHDGHVELDIGNPGNGYSGGISVKQSEADFEFYLDELKTFLRDLELVVSAIEK